MPTYRFKDLSTGKEFEQMISFTQKQSLLEADSNIEALPPTQFTIGYSVVTAKSKADDGWKETLSKIAEANPNTPLGNEYGSKSAKESKTRAAVEKWRSKNEAAKST